MRKILFANERVNVKEYETFYFIAVLVVFAIIAATTVLVYGFQESDRNQFKLVLHCIMIITSVVPPELPMELSLAITSSLTALAKCLVYCTEPFRLPFAGKLEILCFDKTGTLTQDKMYLKGVIPTSIATDLKVSSLVAQADINFIGSSVSTEAVTTSNTPELLVLAMASCHSLVLRSNENPNSFFG